MLPERIHSFAIAVEILIGYRKDGLREEERSFRPTVLRSGRDLAGALEKKGIDTRGLRAFLNAVESPLVAEQGPPVARRWAPLRAELERLAESLASPVAARPPASARVRNEIERFQGVVDRFLAQHADVVRREAMPDRPADPRQDPLTAALKRGLAPMRLGLLTAGKDLLDLLESSGNDGAPLRALLSAIEAEKLPDAASLWPTLQAALSQIAGPKN